MKEFGFVLLMASAIMCLLSVWGANIPVPILLTSFMVGSFCETIGVARGNNGNNNNNNGGTNQ